jgi:hypothetical protein
MSPWEDRGRLSETNVSWAWGMLGLFGTIRDHWVRVCFFVEHASAIAAGALAEVGRATAHAATAKELLLLLLHLMPFALAPPAAPPVAA